MTDILMTIGLIVALALGGLIVYLQWQKATPAQRADIIAEEARRLVEWAEETYKDDAGSTKYGRVLNRIMRRFPEADLGVLEEYIQQAVLHMKGSQTARQGVTLNGKSDTK